MWRIHRSIVIGESVDWSRYFGLLIRWQMCLMLFHDMQVPSFHMGEIDQQVIKNVLKQVRLGF